MNFKFMNRILAALFILIPFLTQAQLGGQQVFTFLKLPTSARGAALGGNQISVRDNDLNLVADNPALLTPELHNNATATYINYISDINMGYIAYARDYEDIGTFSLGIQSIGYGDFTRADETGQTYGDFRAAEYALDVSYARELSDAFTFGATAKFIYSNFVDYNSFGAAIDLGAHYLSHNELFSAGLVINNLGYQLKPYVEGEREGMPTEVQLGASYKLPKAPIRFNLLLHNMQQWDITNDDAAEGVPTITQSGTQTAQGDVGSLLTFDKLAHHMNIGAEIIPSDKFHLRIGYNYYRRQTIGNTTGTGISGFSFGAGIRIKKIHINYGLASYHLAGTSHHMSLTANLSEFKRK